MCVQYSQRPEEEIRSPVTGGMDSELPCECRDHYPNSGPLQQKVFSNYKTCIWISGFEALLNFHIFPFYRHIMGQSSLSSSQHFNKHRKKCFHKCTAILLQSVHYAVFWLSLVSGIRSAASPTYLRYYSQWEQSELSLWLETEIVSLCKRKRGQTQQLFGLHRLLKQNWECLGLFNPHWDSDLRFKWQNIKKTDLLGKNPGSFIPINTDILNSHAFCQSYHQY